MNVNVKLSISDEDRNLMSKRLTGKDTKKMVSRAEVNEWVKGQLETFLRLGSPASTRVTEEIKEDFEEIDMDNIDVEEVMRQNKLLLNRVNVLQFALDKKR